MARNAGGRSIKRTAAPIFLCGVDKGDVVSMYLGRAAGRPMDMKGDCCASVHILRAIGGIASVEIGYPVNQAGRVVAFLSSPLKGSSEIDAVEHF